MKFSKAWKGSVSIFLCLIMLPMVTYSTMIIDATRLQTSRSTIASAGDLAMNAALSEYEQTLEDMYGLFAVSKSPEELKKHLGVYFTETIESKLFNDSTDINTKYIADSIVEAIFSETPTDELTNLINLNVESFDYKTVSGSTLANQAIMKKQIVEYMKYKGPVSLVNTLIPKLDFLKDSSKQTEVVQKKIEYTQTLNDLQEVCEKAWKEIQGEKDDEDHIVNEGYNKPAEEFNERYKGENINNYVEHTEEFLHYVSHALLMNKNTHVTEKLPTWKELTSYDAVNQFKTANSINFPEWNNKSTVEDLQRVINEIEDIYTKYIVDITGYGNENDNFEKEHLSVKFDKDLKKDEETDEEWLRRVETSIEVSEKPVTDNNIAYTNVLNTYIAEMPMETNDVIGHVLPDLNALEKHYHSQNEAYDSAQLFKDDLKDIAVSLVISGQLADAMESAFNRYEELVNAEIADIEVKEDKNEDSEEENSEESSEEDENEGEDKSEEARNDILNNRHYYKYKLKKIVLESINSKFRDMGYNTSISTFVDKVNNKDLYYHAAEKYYSSATYQLKIYYQNINEIMIRSGYVVSALEEIEKKIETSNNKKDEWQGKVDSLSSSSTKSTMQSDLDTTTDGLNKEDVTALKKVMEQVKSDFKQRMEEVMKIKFLGVSIATGRVDDFKDNSVFENVEDNINIKAGNIVSDNFEKVGFPDKALLAEVLDGNPAKDENDKPVELFYTTLKSICEPLKTEINEEQKKPVDVINQNTEVNEDGTPKNEIPDSKENSEDSGSSEGKKSEIISEANGQTIGKIYEEIAKEAKVEKKADENTYKASGTTFDIESDNYDDNANNATDSLSQATKILNTFADIAKDAINYAYLEEYFTEMFTCRTDPILAKKGNVTFLNGYTIGEDEGKKQINTNTAWYGNEIEYILWGNDDFSKNRTYTDAWIYVVRFALNAIYAFTAADIQSFALEIATAIAGWTVIGVPIVQACITVAIALAESAYDLKLLHDGKDVPIYKNASTFVCSPAGFTTQVLEGAVQDLSSEVANKLESSINSKIDAIAEKGYGKVEEAIGAVDNVLNDYVEQELQTIESTITAQFVTPIINSVSGVFTDIDTSIDKVADSVNENIKNTVNDAWDTIGNNIKNNMTENSLIQKYTLVIYEGIGENQKDKLISEIQGYFSEYVNQLKSNKMPPNPATELRNLLTNKETGIIPNWFQSIEISLKTQIEQQINPVKDEIKNLKDEEVGNIKSILNDKIDSVSSYIGNATNGFIEDAMSNVSKPVSLSKSNKADTATSGGFTLNYKEYCKIMVFVKLINPLDAGAEGKMLNRAATLMQANVITATNNANSNFKIVNAYTLIGVNATVEMGTLFPWAVEVSDTSNADGSLGAKLDFNNLGDYKIKIKYNAVNGY